MQKGKPKPFALVLKKAYLEQEYLKFGKSKD